MSGITGGKRNFPDRQRAAVSVVRYRRRLPGGKRFLNAALTCICDELIDLASLIQRVKFPLLRTPRGIFLNVVACRRILRYNENNY